MSRIVIKILNEDAQSLGHIHVDGLAGLNYLFIWDRIVGGYTYAPKNQQEIDDIFACALINRFPYRFAPVLIDGEQGTTTPRLAPPPLVLHAAYEKMPLEELVTLCADCGFGPADSSNRAMVMAQLDAFYLGRAWTDAEKPSKPAAKAAVRPRAPMKEPVGADV